MASTSRDDDPLGSPLKKLRDQLLSEQWQFGDANPGVRTLCGLLEPNLFRGLEMASTSRDDDPLGSALKKLRDQLLSEERRFVDANPGVRGLHGWVGKNFLRGLEMASISRDDDPLGSALKKLRDQLLSEQWRFGDANAGVRGLRGLLEPNLRRIGDRSLYNNLKFHIVGILIIWRFIRTFIDYVHKWTDADKVVPDLGSLIIKTEVGADEIADQIRIACEKKYVSKSPSKLIDILHASQTKIQQLKQENGEALESISGCSFQLYSPLHDFSQWIEFVGSTEINVVRIWLKVDGYLEKQVYALKKKLKRLRSFLSSCFTFGFPNDCQFRDFFAHVASTVNEAASLSCLYGFKEADSRTCSCCPQNFGSSDANAAKSTIIKLLDMQHEIDPATPEFLELTLKFLKALNKTRPGHTTDQVHLVDCFVKYFIGEEYDYRLHSLVNFFINIPEDSINQNVDLFLAEIKENISYAISLNDILDRSIWHRDTFDKIRLLKNKIWLLKVEIFLKVQLSSWSIFRFSVIDTVEDLTKCPKQPPEDSDFLRMERSEIEEQALMLIRKIAYLRPSCHAKKIKRYKLRNSIFILLSKIAIFKAKSMLMELSNVNETFMALIKDQLLSVDPISEELDRLMNVPQPSAVIASVPQPAIIIPWSFLSLFPKVNNKRKNKDQLQDILWGLELFTAFVRSKEAKDTEDVENIFSLVEGVARRIILLCYSFLANKVTEGEIKSLFSDLLDMIKPIREELRKICPEIPRSKFPKSDGLGIINFLSGNLFELLKHDPDSIASVKHHLEEIRLDIELLRSFLMIISEHHTEHSEMKNFASSVTKMAYTVEYVIDSIEAGIGALWQHLLWLTDILEGISLIKVLATQLFKEKNPEARVHSITQIYSHTSEARIAKIDEEAVCLKDQEEVIIERLTRGSSQRYMVCIVGMPGIGKTTLAKKVYNDPKVLYHFHRRTWCSVSQVYRKRDLLLSMLRDVHGLTDEIQEMSDADLELKLSQCLRKNRYLIVMDDVWDIGAWNDLERSFPNDGNGSRILMTSRLKKVALEVNTESDPHSLRELSQEESWKLLEMKIFHNRGCCPEELIDIGKEIAVHCKGLPLAIVAIAGILTKTEKKCDWWKRIVEELNSWVINDPETRCKEILQLSYSNLPVHLKACFLHFGALQEDKDIQVTKLIRLWVGEGFIQQTETKRLEEIAEDYLTDLTDRSLVIISKRRSNGRVKACTIHDLLRDLCRSKSKEEMFLQLITRYDEPYASFQDADYGVDFDYFDSSNHVTCESYRLCFCLKWKQFVDSRPSGPCTRSLMFSASSDLYPRRHHDISFICQQFKLLRVLDLESINMGSSFPIGLELLVQLRYLALSGDLNSIPRSIANLWKLETFIVKGLSGKVELPDTFWSMTKLRHVHIKSHAVFNLQDGHSLQLYNLVTFSSPSLSSGEDTEKIMRKLPNLRVLECIFLESWDSSSNCNQFPRLDFLTQLESLKILYSGRFRYPGEFNLPQNLKKLTLSNFRLPWSHISAIGRLPNLEVLKLRVGAFHGLTWDMTEGEDEFRELKFLQLDSLDIIQWKASSDNFPKLRQLVLRNCKDLNEVPDFDEFCTLEMIELQRCGKSIEESIKEMANATEGLQVLITGS